MATSNSSDKTATELNRLLRDPTLPRHAELGIDAEGYVHHLDRRTRRVHRVGVRGRERVCDLWRLNDSLGAAVEAYVHDYVGNQIGWRYRAPTTRDWFGPRPR